MRIETTDGRSLEQYVEFPKGHAASPMDRDELVVKFAALASPDLSDDQVEKIYDLITRFDELDNVQPLFHALKIR